MTPQNCNAIFSYYVDFTIPDFDDLKLPIINVVKRCKYKIFILLCFKFTGEGVYSADHAEAVREGIKKVSTGFFETWAVLPRKTEVF